MAAAYFSIKAHQANVQLGDKKDNEMRGVVRAGEGVGRGWQSEWAASKTENRLRVCRLQHARVS